LPHLLAFIAYAIRGKNEGAKINTFFQGGGAFLPCPHSRGSAATSDIYRWLLSVLLTLAPCCSSRRQVDAWPLHAASISDVRPR